MLESKSSIPSARIERSNLDSSPTTTTILHGALRFTVDVAGPDDGAPVLLLHGFPQSRYAWRHQLNALAGAGFRAYAPDQRGYSGGARPLEAEAYAIENLIDDAQGLMATVGAPRYHVVGHDWGGYLAWTLALRSPQQVASLTVLSRPHPAAFAESFKHDAEQAQRSGHHAGLLAPGKAQEFRDNNFAWFRKIYQEQAVPPEAAEHYLSTLSEAGAIEAAIHWYRFGAANMRDPAAARITMPTLYIWGNQDATVGRYAAQATAKYVDGAFRFVEIPGAGHYLTDEVPEQVSALLVQHLAGCPV